MKSDLSDYGDPYVELRNGNLYIRGTRVQLASILLYWMQGKSAEDLRASFPWVRPAAIYGALAFYFDHTTEVERFLSEYRARWDAFQAAEEAAHPEVYAKLRRILAEGRARHEAESQPASETEAPVS